MTTRKKTVTALPCSALRRSAERICAFRHDESGVMAAPAILFFLAMVMIGGIGIDLMRMERDRTVLQYTLDRAVLAAADLDQTQDANLVVQDYLNKSGLGHYYSPENIDVSPPALGYKRVKATINTDFRAHLLKLTSGGDLPLYATSTAEESIDGLEISLVLDVSGSMNSNSRLTNLKVAAKEFIDTMVANTNDGKMSISIVPYATQVSVPDDLIGEYSTVGTNNYSNCINFEAAQYNRSGLSTTETLKRSMHFTPWGYSSRDMRTYYSSPRLVNSPVCDNRASREILPLQKDASTLKTFIQNLSAGGNTSIDTGMKWGTALLDPSARPAIAAISSGAGASVPSDFSARPADYDDSETIKIIVLMTDGQNTSQYYVRDQFRDGDSGVWYNAHYDSYSTYASYNNRYFFHYNNSWYNHPYGSGNGESGDAVRLSYSELFARTSLKYLYRYIYGEWDYNARNNWYYDVFNSHGNSTKNTRTRSICTAAKAQGIIVYTIGFEAPSNGVAVLRDCASTDAHYFDVNGLEIKDAFASIATSIRQLRLTQ